MKKIVKLTEKDLSRIVKKIINESRFYDNYDDDNDEWIDERDELEASSMRLLKPYYDRHGLEITLDLIDTLKTFVEDGVMEYY
jgi:hypothetical protein